MTKTKNKKKHKFLGVFLVLLLLPLASSAAVMRSGQDVSITDDQVVEDDFYAAGSVVSSSGEIRGDFYAATEVLTNNGKVGGDMAVLADRVELHSEVTDDVRVVARTVTVAEHVGGDLVVVAGSLEVLSTAKIDGDILFYGGKLKVLGDVDGSVMGTAGEIRVDAYVGGSVDVQTEQLTLGNRAEILGDVRYTSHNDLVRGQDATVLGETVKNSVSIEVSSGIPYEAIIVFFVIVLFAALVLQMLLRPQLLRLLPIWTGNIGISGLLGIAFVMVTPLVCVLAMGSFLGLVLGALTFFGYIFMVLLAVPLMSIVAGALLAKYTKKDTTQLNVLYTVGGAALLQLVLFIPVIGAMLLIILYFVTLGGLVLGLYRFFRA